MKEARQMPGLSLWNLLSYSALASFASARFFALYFFRYSRIRALWASHFIVLPPPT